MCPLWIGMNFPMTSPRIMLRYCARYLLGFKLTFGLLFL